jgi:hypothetical protein
MRTLLNSVVSLAWRSANGSTPTDVCHLIPSQENMVNVGNHQDYTRTTCVLLGLFQQYILTVQIESDLLCASHAMLMEVANNVKRPSQEGMYLKIMSSVLSSMQGWAEKRLLSYHNYFQSGEHVLLCEAVHWEEDVGGGRGGQAGLLQGGQ